MKILIALLLCAVLTAELWNAWRMQRIEAEIAALQVRVQRTAGAVSATQDWMTAAVPALAAAARSARSLSGGPVGGFAHRAMDQIGRISRMHGASVSEWLHKEAQSFNTPPAPAR